MSFSNLMASFASPPPKLKYSDRPAIWRIKRAFTVKFSRVLDQPVNVWQLLGTDEKGLEKYLQRSFKKGMTWENFGKVWEVRPSSPMKDEKGCNLSNFKPQFKVKARA